MSLSKGLLAEAPNPTGEMNSNKEARQLEFTDRVTDWRAMGQGGACLQGGLCRPLGPCKSSPEPWAMCTSGGGWGEPKDTQRPHLLPMGMGQTSSLLLTTGIW